MAILWFGVSDAAPDLPDLPGQRLPDLTVGDGGGAEHPAGLPPRGAELRPRRPRAVPPVILPASLPQILTGLRIALGVAWLVVVAAEMIAVNSGLGYLIIDARNAGKRYDLVVAGMALIGLIGLGLDLLVRRLETLDEVRWGLMARAASPSYAIHLIFISFMMEGKLMSPSRDRTAVRSHALEVIVRDLWMTFPGKDGRAGHQRPGGVNLEVGEGEFVCIVGPSGCGKSTLLNIVGGFLAATQGRGPSTARR